MTSPTDATLDALVASANASLTVKAEYTGNVPVNAAVNDNISDVVNGTFDAIRAVHSLTRAQLKALCAARPNYQSGGFSCT